MPNGSTRHRLTKTPPPKSRLLRIFQDYILRHVGATGLALASLALLAGGFSVWDMYRRTIEQATRDVSGLGIVLAEQTARHVQVMDLILRRAANRVRTLGPRTPAEFNQAMSRQDARDYLAELAENLPRGHAVGLFDAAGAPLSMAAENGLSPPSISALACLRQPVTLDGGGLCVDVPDAEPLAGTPSRPMIVARRLNGPDGVLLGVAAITARPDYLLAFYEALNLRQPVAVTLLRRDGLLLLRYPLLLWHNPSLGGAMIRVPESSLWHAVVASGHGTFRSSGKVTGFPSIVSVEALPDYPLVLDVSVREHDVLASWRRDAAYLSAAAIILAAAFVTLFRVIARQLRAQQRQNISLADTSEALRSSEARLRDFIAMASDWLWEQDADLRLSWFHSSSDWLTSQKPARLGKHRWTYQDTSHDPENWARHQRDLEARLPFHDYRYKTDGPDEQTAFSSISGRPLYDDSGTFLGYRGVGRDITAEIAVERELRDAKERAERAENLLRDAVDSISESLTIWDPDDRLVAYNQVWAERYSKAIDAIEDGLRYEDLMRRRVEAGEYLEAAGQEEAWLAENLRQHKAASGAYERQLSDAKWLRITHRRMRNGGTVILNVDITETKRNELALRDSEDRFERAQAAAGIGTWEMDTATQTWFWSKQIYRSRGLDPDIYSPATDAGKSQVHPDDQPRVAAWLEDLRNGIQRPPIEERILSSDGAQRIRRLEGRAMFDAAGVATRIVGTVQDVTEQRMTERQLAHAQKMEVIGNLTGGMAHDFNNLLGIIVINLDTLRLLLKNHEAAAPLVEDSLTAALSGARLTQQLLAFARRQALAPAVIDINVLVTNMAALMRRTLGEAIQVSFHLASDLWPVFADPAQLEASILNLALNARDAMPQGGKLSISTRNTSVDPVSAPINPDLAPGDYATLVVTDTGTGMAAEIKDRIFEPFFTTKERGDGTGLGLSMVFGFLQQSNGLITVYSEPGRGSDFRLYFPRSGRPGIAEACGGHSVPAEGNGETILVVEDNASLRKSLVRLLSGLNYRLLEAYDADSALTILEANDVHLVFTDVVMPGTLDGIALARMISKGWPEVSLVLTSGFVETKLNDDRSGVLARTRFLQKPFRRDVLARVIRGALDDTDRDHGAAPGGASDKRGVDAGQKTIDR